MKKDNDTLQNKNNELNEKIEKLQVFFIFLNRMVQIL